MSYSEKWDSYLTSGKNPIVENDQFTLLLKEKVASYEIGSPQLIKTEDYNKFRKCYNSMRGDNAFDILRTWIPCDEPGINGSILRFIVALKMYDEKFVVYPKLDELLIKGKEKYYLEHLKKVRQKSFLISTNSILEEETEEYKQLPYHVIGRDIGEIFNYQWLPWIEVEVNDFFEVSFKPIEHQDEKYFRKITRNWFSNQKEGFKVNLDYIKNAVLINIKNTATQFGPNWFERQFKDKNYFSTFREAALRKIIHVAPGNARDTIINRLADLNTINLIERVLFKFLIHIDAPSITDDYNEFQRNYTKFCTEYNYYWCRDFEKEGLTRPRYINRIILEEFNKFTGMDLPANFFDNYEVIHNDVIYSPIRGTGLGMANSIVTIMQLILHSETINQTASELMNSDEEQNLKFDFFCLNDDNIAAFENEDDLEMFKLIEQKIFDRLGLIKKKSKSFHSYKAGVFCEQYFSSNYSNINRKESFINRIKFDYCRIKNPLLRYERYRVPDVCKVQEFLPIELGGCLEGEFSNTFLLEDRDLSEKELIEMLALNELTKKFFPKSCFHQKIRDSFEKEYDNPLDQVYPSLRDIIKDSEKGFFNYVKIKEIAQKFNTLGFNSKKELEFYNKCYYRKRDTFEKLYRNFNKLQYSFEWENYLTLLLKSNKYIIPEKLGDIVLSVDDIEHLSLDNNGNLFETEEPFIDFINYRMDIEGNPFGMFFKKKIVNLDEWDTGFPVPRDESLYKMFFATYGTLENARIQYKNTGCLPLLREERCSEKNIEISNMGITRRFIDFVAINGPVTDFKIIKLLDSLSEKAFECLLEIVSETFMEEKEMIIEDELTQEELELISFLRSPQFNQQYYPKVEVEQVIEPIQEEEVITDKERYINDIYDIVYKQYYQIFQPESFKSFQDYEIFKEQNDIMLRNIISECYDRGIFYSADDGEIILPSKELDEIDTNDLFSYVNLFLDTNKYPFDKSENLKYHMAVSKVYKTLMNNMMEQEFTTRIQELSLQLRLEPRINGFDLDDILNDVVVLRTRFQSLDNEEEDTIILLDDW